MAACPATTHASSPIIMTSLPRFQISPHCFCLLLIPFIFLGSIPGTLSTKTVRLRSIEIFDTHEWLASSATVYFHCNGENKTILPDVKENHFLYTFKGEESWQPLTELDNKKCKRCGLYEMDSIKSDDIFDEWELCPDEFINGEYEHIKDMEFIATFICNECKPVVNSTQAVANKKDEEKRMNVTMVVIISALVSIAATAITVTAYKYWQKRKREQDQARFLKLFDEGDDIEDELSL
ncbi:Concanavalin A-like lectin/glucanase domain-containing protein [Dioscorea alata]|uniref:Concanavalin A-like lectin/glucanase domain-containing protein n=1 Tax=Dioscorea alata TaxID=55571 RepID=A0ACB7U9B4_DIOAL|nr:Concanavalin A-like lectin/glucanase domain-containing protein [Dioscorea alata]